MGNGALIALDDGLDAVLFVVAAFMGWLGVAIYIAARVMASTGGMLVVATVVGASRKRS